MAKEIAQVGKPTPSEEPVKVVILGAAGRDFHNFNMLFRNNPRYRVVAFTATQIPGIEGRVYPSELAGPGYEEGIPIVPEERLEDIIRENGVRLAVFSYSDVSHEHVMHLASRASAAGAGFLIPGAQQTMLQSRLPVIAVTATRTGAGKSTVTRKVVSILRARGLRVAVIRHPMPYGDLKRQVVQRFETVEDLDRQGCTLEEREEYEPHLRMGSVVYAGIDYERVLREAEREADIIVWDGGNNDTPFIKPGLWITLVDPHRAGHELSYHPGETNLRMADVVIVTKVDTARPEDIEKTLENTRKANPRATLIEAALPLSLDNPSLVRGKSVVAVEDGPTVTHGGLGHAGAYIAARKYGAGKIVDPKPYAVGSIRRAYSDHPHLGPVVPTLGYTPGQLRDLEETLRRVPSEAIVSATPVDLSRLINPGKPIARVSYELEELGRPKLDEIVGAYLEEAGAGI